MIDNNFKLDMLLGTGGSSKVYSCHDPTGNIFAAKIIRKDKKFSESLAKSLLNTEMEIMQEMFDHPNILNGIFSNTDGTFKVNGQSESIMYCIIELAKKGAIKTFVKRSGSFEENLARFYAIQLVNALAHLHYKGFAHMDIKLENILLDEKYNAKIADFGTCVRTENGMTNRKCGTKQYMAPEILEKDTSQSFDAFKADAYSLGVTIYYMLTGEFPQQNESTSLTSTSSNNSTVSSANLDEKYLFSHISEECKDFLTNLLSKDSSKRASIFEILEHPWISNAEKCLPISEIFLEMKAREDYIIGASTNS